MTDVEASGGGKMVFRSGVQASDLSHRNDSLSQQREKIGQQCREIGGEGGGKGKGEKRSKLKELLSDGLHFLWEVGNSLGRRVWVQRKCESLSNYLWGEEDTATKGLEEGCLVVAQRSLGTAHLQGLWLR